MWTEPRRTSGIRASSFDRLAPPGTSMRGRQSDVVVIGGSAGSLEVLQGLVSGLPPDIPAALFVVVHVLPLVHSRLPEILERRAPVPVRHARDGDLIEHRRVLVAPPDHHMVLHPDRVELNRGPRENSARPAIDPLFRSAATAFGPRVSGVIVSGNLDDGSAGLTDVVATGGTGIVQDPAEALHPEMPRNALLRCPSCHIAPAAAIARMLLELALGGRPPRDDAHEDRGRAAEERRRAG